MTGFRDRARRWMPGPLWVGLRRLWSYARRLGYWVLVLKELRGDGWREALKLYASALAGPVTALPRLDSWRDPQLLFDTRVRAPVSGRFDCRRATDDLWHVLPSAQGQVRRAIAENLPAGGVFVDAGANIGGFTVFGARLAGPDGKVLAVEMMPDTATRLRSHLEQNGLTWVRVVEAALSDRSGLEVVAKMPAGLAGQASIAQPERSREDLIEVRVKTTTLDDAAAELPHIDVLKMDLEGAEALALEGGRGMLARTKCVIFEDWGEAHAGQGGDAGPSAARIVESAGLTLRRLDGNNMIGLW